MVGGVTKGQGGAGGGANGKGGGGTGFSGSANTGGGGGSVDSFMTSGSGGSGVVILKYPDTYSLAASTEGSPVYTTSGNYHIYQFNDTGSITF
jgi:hypothetical protein